MVLAGSGVWLCGSDRNRSAFSHPAGRGAVDRGSQPFINDASKGHKGFTVEVFEKQLFATFKQRTGIDVSDLTTASVPEMARPLLDRLLQESKKTVASYQPVINMPGIPTRD